MQALVEELKAERSAAQARHEELLMHLQQHGDGHESRHDAILQGHRSIEARIEEAVKVSAAFGSPTGDDTGGGSGAHRRKSLKQFEERAQRLIRKDGEAEQFNGENHLSKESKFEFGIKDEEEEVVDVNMTAYILHQARKIVEHDRFEVVVAFFIFSNAIVMCCETQYAGFQVGHDVQYAYMTDDAQDVWPAAGIALPFFEWFFGIIFTLEAALKLVALHKNYFCSLWNVLDFISVAAFLADKTAKAFGTRFIDAQVVRLIRLFRLVRLVRLIRTLEQCDMLYVMTTAVKGMKSIVVWSIFMLSVILMACSLFLSQYLHAVVFNKVATDEAGLASQQQLFKYFGTFSRCMLSMFEITLANWTPVARLLAEEVSEWFCIISILHKLSIGFAVIGVINGVIMQETFRVSATDNMVMVRQRRREKAALKAKMEALFQALDYDQSGSLEFEEFMIIAGQPDVQSWLESLEIEVDDLLTLFLLIDRDGDGSLTLEELLTAVPRFRGTARGIDLMAMRHGIPSTQLLQEISNENGEKKLVWGLERNAVKTKENLEDILGGQDNN